MEIHELLKENRLKLGLTQKQMAEGIVSTSFYSRVEQGISRITAIDLLMILKLHGINTIDFFSQITVNVSNGTDKEEKFIDELFIAFFSDDLYKVRQLKAEIYKDKNLSKKVKLYFKLIEALLLHNVSSIDKKTKIDIKNELFNGLNWSIPTLKLFINSMFIYNTDEILFLVNSILNKYKNSQNEIIQKLVASVCINFLDLSYQNSDFTFWGKSLDFLKNLPNVPDLLMYKLLGKYYQSILNNDKNAKIQIRKSLSISGYSNYLKLLP